VKAFVTGATGFVGAHLVRALLARGDRVTCLVRSPAKAQAQRWPPEVRLVRGDLDDATALATGCADTDVVFHLAGRISARNLAEFLAANRDGTARLIQAAAAQPPQRFVYVSSLAVGGPAEPGHPVDERRAPAPVTNYGRSKLAGEELVRAAPYPWTIVRPPVVYGEWDREVLRVFRFARLGWAPVIGDGSQELSLIYAGDLATALIAAATATGTAGHVYYAAHPEVTTSHGFVEAIGRAVGRRPRVVRLPGLLARAALGVVGSLAYLAGRATLLSLDKANEFLAPAWTCRADALGRDAGWHAQTAMETGLAQTASWYRTEGWL
jgi:nucleoside-diphosphate-sugar epimerase